MKRRVAYLGVETKARELLGKVLLASKAAERGWQVVMAHQREIRAGLRHRPPGAYFEISIPEGKAKRVASYKSAGHRIANLCEENIVYHDGWDYCRRKVGNATLKHVDVMLVSGDRNARDLRQYRPESADRIVLTGNPRFDTLMPDARAVYQAEADTIRERFGRFLLVNTNFGPVNHFSCSSEELLDRLRGKNEIEDEAHADMMRRWYSYKRVQMDRLKPQLAKIALSGAFDNVILRPHPSENHETWREWATPLGIKVIFEGSANNWLLAADAILHTGCTTGIEGVLLDRPVASFVPEPGHEMLNQSDEISVQFAHADEFLAYADQWRSLGRDDLQSLLQAQRMTLKSMIANVEPPMSADRILDALDSFDLPEVPVETFRRPRHRPFSAIGARIRSVVNALPGAHERQKSQRYKRQKFPGLEGDDIMVPIAAWSGAGVLGRVPDVSRLHDGSWLYL